MRVESSVAWAQSRQGWFSSAFSRKGASSCTRSRRTCIVKADVTPTWCSTPASSYRPSSREPTASWVSRYQRKPATTQSAVRECLILYMARLPGWYGADSGLAITPSRPAPSKRCSQSCATARSRVTGVRCTGGAMLASSRSSRMRRSDCGSSIVERPPAASRSKATKDAGVDCASLATREAAGCSRCCSASKSRPLSPTTTISPSSTQPRGRVCASARSSSGK